MRSRMPILAYKRRPRDGCGGPWGGLESVKKTHQVAEVGKVFGAPCHPPINSGPTTPSRSGHVTMAQGIKRLATPIAALLGLVLAGLVASSWLINRDALRQAVEAQIR